MEITRGLFDNMVIQRIKNSCDQPVEGTCHIDGTLLVYVQGVTPQPVRIGKALRGTFSGNIKGIPIGGPYEIELTIKNEKSGVQVGRNIKNVLVGDVWICAGQSNMEGMGLLTGALKKNPAVRAFYMDDHWALAQDPLHQHAIAVDPIHLTLSNGVRYIGKPVIGEGPSHSFGLQMHKATGVPQGLIPCGHGATTMAQWSPQLAKTQESSLFGALSRRIYINGGRVAGMIWYQGCSDTDDAAIKVYLERMQEFIAALRSVAHTSKMPVVMAQISHTGNSRWNGNNWERIRELQRKMPNHIENLATISTIDLSLDDWIHISGYDQHRVGKRMAHAMRGLMKMPNAKLPIALKSIAMRRNPRNCFATIFLTYGNVVGELHTAGGRPTGYMLTQKEGDLGNDSIYRIECSGDTVVLHTALSILEVQQMLLYYGHGCECYCNIIDAADNALPAMGPIRIAPAKALTSDVTKCRTFGPVLLDADFSKIANVRENLQWTYKDFGNPFLNMNPAIGPTSPQNGIMWYVVDIMCKEPMKLAVHLGYDGPVKAWVNGKLFFTDLNGTNPCVAGKGSGTVNVTQGMHTLVVALCTNNGCAWGTFIRFERLDCSQADIDARNVVLPEIGC